MCESEHNSLYSIAVATSIMCWHLSCVSRKDNHLWRAANERTGGSFRKVMVRNKQVMYYVCCNFVTCKFVFFLYIHIAKKNNVALQYAKPFIWEA